VLVRLHCIKSYFGNAAPRCIMLHHSLFQALQVLRDGGSPKNKRGEQTPTGCRLETSLIKPEESLFCRTLLDFDRGK